MALGQASPPMDAHLDGFPGYLPCKDASMKGTYRAAPILDSKSQRTGNNPVTDTHEVQRADLQPLLQHRMRPFPLLMPQRDAIFVFPNPRFIVLLCRMRTSQLF